LLMGPLLGPMLFAFVINLSIERSLSDIDRSMALPVIGAAHAPNLMRFLQSRNIEIIDGPADRDAAVAAVKAGEIEFRDINLEPDALSAFGANIEDIRRRLYGLDADGHLSIGADCAIEIWRRTPGDRWLASLLRLPVLRQISSFTYDRFASLLYGWNRRKGHW